MHCHRNSRRHRPLLLGALALAVLATSAEAADWSTLDQSPDKAVTLMFTPPVTPGQGNQAHIWVRWEFTQRRNGPGTPTGPFTYLSAVSLDEVDCADMRSRTLQTTFYAGAGMSGAATTSTQPSEWQYQVPGTMGDHEAQFACASLHRAPAPR